MTRSGLAALLLASALCSAAPREPLVLLFTGDNGGEVAPCG